MNLSYYLALFMLGCILYEISGRLTAQLEAQDDYSSPLYLGYVSIITVGLTLALTSILTMVKEVEKQLKDNHGYKIKTSLIDLSLFVECKKVMVFIYNKFRKS